MRKLIFVAMLAALLLSIFVDMNVDNTTTMMKAGRTPSNQHGTCTQENGELFAHLNGVTTHCGSIKSGAMCLDGTCNR